MGCWLAAVVLLVWNLGGVSLRDWDEALVARVALEFSQGDQPLPLLPTLWGEPYLNKPPLLHALIALVIRAWSGLDPAAAAAGPPPEAVVRVVPALLSSLIVPLLGLVQWRLRPGDRLTLFSTMAVAITLLPLMRHGRLAMLDGSLIAAMALQWWALLSLAPNASAAALRRWGLLAGLAGSALLLLKAPVLIPLLPAVCLVLAWEQRWPWWRWRDLLQALLLGLMPALLWHGWHLLARGPQATLMWTGQGMARLTQAMEGHGGGWITPLIQVLVGGGPWLLLWPFAMVLAWRERQRRSGLWVLALTLLTAAIVLPLRTQLPWYSHLLWPSFCLAVGPVLAWLVRRDPDLPIPAPAWLARLPQLWLCCGVAVLLLIPHLALPLVPLLSAGAALLLGGFGLSSARLQRRRRGLIALIAGLWFALLALFAGPSWLWELHEQWPVHPLVERIRALPADLAAMPMAIDARSRPSLNWYLQQELHHPHGRPGEVLLLIANQAPSSRRWSCAPLDQRAADQVLPADVPSLWRCERQPPPAPTP